MFSLVFLYLICFETHGVYYFQEVSKTETLATVITGILQTKAEETTLRADDTSTLREKKTNYVTSRGAASHVRSIKNN